MAKPADDMKDIVAELSQVGVKGLNHVGQVMVNTTPDGRFQIRCSPEFWERPVELSVSGQLDRRRETPSLNIDISAEMCPQAPVKGQDPDDGRQRRLVDLDTVISAPFGHYVVVGVTPISTLTSVFVVQVTPHKKQ